MTEAAHHVRTIDGGVPLSTTRRRGGVQVIFLTTLLVALLGGGCTERQEKTPQNDTAESGAVRSEMVDAELMGAEVVRGVIVEEVLERSSGQKAGIEVGDTLIGWRLEARSGTIDDTAPRRPPPEDGGEIRDDIDLIRLRDEQMPRGSLVVFGFHRGEAQSWILAPGEPGLVVRPPLPTALLERYREARELEAEARRLKDSEAHSDANSNADWQETSAASARLYEALAVLAAPEEPRLASFFHHRAAGLHHLARRWRAAVTNYDEAAREAENAGLFWHQARQLFHRANTLSRRLDDAGAAREVLEAATEIWRRHGSPLAVASALDLRGEIERRRGELAAAAEALQLSLEIKRQQAPESLSLALTLSVLGKVETLRGNHAQAEGWLQEANALRSRLDPGGMALAHSLGALGVLRLIRGDLAGAESEIRQALERFEAIDSTSDNVAVSLSNLGTLATQRGDLINAERLLRRSLAMAEAERAESLDVSLYLQNLAVLSRLRGNRQYAERLGRRALEIRRRLAPGSLDVAASLDLLASLESDAGELEKAAALWREALEIERLQASNSLEEARAEHNLARIEMEQGEFDAARRRLDRAEALMRAIGPRFYQLGTLLRTRGELEARAGRPREAEARYRQAIEQAESVAGVAAEAEARWGLARLLDGEGRRGEALELYRQAEASLETQQRHFGGDQETRARFRARFHGLNRRRVELEVETGDVAAAFEALEAFRARVLRALLAERDLVFADVPPGLDTERRRAATRLERAQENLREAPELTGAEQMETHLTELAEARQQLRQVRERIRQEAPDFPGLEYTGLPFSSSSLDASETLEGLNPEPAQKTLLTVREARASLDEGTLALVYSLGSSSSLLFVLEAGAEIEAHRLEIGESELEEEIERFRLLMRGALVQGTGGLGHHAELSTIARRLYRRLVAPAQPRVKDAERLLIVPDGPLHLLPFAALEIDAPDSEIQSTDASARRYLGIALPLHSATSLAVHGLIRGRRNKPRSPDPGPAAFADPGPRARPEETLVERDGFSPLPASRGEAWAIKRRFPETRIFFDKKATEAQARSALADARLIHFAVHGFLDERFPLSSGLVLAAGEGDNGLLQAWEIFEGIRTDADLVTLSGCETAIGDKVDGEGLLGLTRALQWAGARSVLASLWRVSDRGTAALMDRLYHHLAAGLPIAEALQAARADLVDGALVPPSKPAGWARRWGRRLGLVEAPEPVDFSHPVYWSGFRLDGDWR